MRALLILGVCVAVVVSGCGGGDDSDSTSSTAETTTSASTPQSSQQSTTGQEQDKGKQSNERPAANGESSEKQGNGSEQTNTSQPHLHLTKVPRISSAPTAGSRSPAPGVKTVAGADNSVQEYGVEADESERREAAIALQAYLNARAEEDWGTACSYLAKRPMEQLERLQEAAAKQGEELGGCAQTLALLKEGRAQALQAAQITEVLSFRGEGDVSGDPSYLIFTAPPGRTLFSMPMYSQGGSWKVGLAKAAELPLG